MAAVVHMSSAVLADIRTHLLPSGSRMEQGGFGFCGFRESGQQQYFDLIEWLPLGPGDYVRQATDYLELADAARARVIKRAHDLKASLVEFHSHPGPYPAALSIADLIGLEEFVPHVRWRLKAKPYAALVFARSSFDGLAWIDSDNVPIQVAGIETGKQFVTATALTLQVHRGRIYG